MDKASSEAFPKHQYMGVDRLNYIKEVSEASCF